jgi:site-specific recombinase XerD
VTVRADICFQAASANGRTSRPGSYAPIVHRWVECAGLNGSAYGTHSLRRTKPAQIYKKTGNLRAVQLLLGHTKLESTVRYLGIEVDDALAVSEQVEL